MQNLEKRPLAPVMRAMVVGEIENYPRSQYRSISVTASNLNIEEGKKYKRKLNGNLVEVKRIA